VKHYVLHFSVVSTCDMGLTVPKFKNLIWEVLGPIMCLHICLFFMRKFIKSGLEATTRTIIWVWLH
jgi:hypothetical protein